MNSKISDEMLSQVKILTKIRGVLAFSIIYIGAKCSIDTHTHTHTQLKKGNNNKNKNNNKF